MTENMNTQPGFTPGPSLAKYAVPTGYVEVDKQAFYGVVGQLNVHPCLGQQRYDEVFGFRCEWKLQAGHGELVGLSVGGTHLSEETYMVTQRFYDANHDAFARLALARARGGAY